ncbi:MAG TPA: hypothetical protein VLI41_14000 [Phenylobacterium sp.]|uniref:hypothetical protein n=1 Tax=Phenylobacterium sp. TaxID=1871053 RepID=UPI002B887241|nr:hypothetical protein [Phenylobacterium sp.]HSV04307.1 hypothetical protein [Phenylobacterium sp.]
MTPNPPPSLPPAAYLVPLVVIGLVILRNARARQLKIERMWVTPAILLALTALTFVQQGPPSAASLELDAAALIVGALLGWWRGRFTRIAVDPATQALTSQTSPIGMLLILAVFALRYGLRAYAAANAGALDLPINDLTDAFLLLAVGLVCAQRLEMALRASRLLKEARAG